MVVKWVTEYATLYVQWKVPSLGLKGVSMRLDRRCVRWRFLSAICTDAVACHRHHIYRCRKATSTPDMDLMGGCILLITSMVPTREEFHDRGYVDSMGRRPSTGTIETVMANGRQYARVVVDRTSHCHMQLWLTEHDPCARHDVFMRRIGREVVHTAHCSNMITLSVMH